MALKVSRQLSSIGNAMAEASAGRWQRPRPEDRGAAGRTQAWRGQAVAQAAKSSKGKAKPGGAKGKQGFASGSGFGSKEASSGQSVDSLSLLRRSEQLYVQLLAHLPQYQQQPQDAARSNSGGSGEEEAEVVLREYIICARACPEQQDGSASDTAGARGAGPTASQGRSHALLPDWLPVAELLLLSRGDAEDDLPLALPFVCRELAECATLKLGNSFPRHVLEYAYESAESFYDEVLPATLGFGDLALQASAEGHACPYSVLGLERGASLSKVRAAYRALAAKHHPDRHEDLHKETAEAEFRRVSSAYERIKGNTGSAPSGGSLSGSYEALGGPKRQGLSAPLRVRPSKGDSALPQHIQLAVRPLEGELVDVFLARIVRRAIAVQTA